MPLPRLQLFELEDLPWFPLAIRDLATDYLHFIELRFALHQPVVPLLRDALEESNMRRVIDLCSGGGGLVPALHQALLAEGVAVAFTLTDKYPNLGAFGRLSKTTSSGLHSSAIVYIAQSVDATRAPPDMGYATLARSSGIYCCCRKLKWQRPGTRSNAPKLSPSGRPRHCWLCSSIIRV